MKRKKEKNTWQKQAIKQLKETSKNKGRQKPKKIFFFNAPQQSKNPEQLKGDNLPSGKPKFCQYADVDESGNAYYPGGLIANTFFNDTFACSYADPGASAVQLTVTP